MRRAELTLWISALSGLLLSLIPVFGGTVLVALSLAVLAILYFTCSVLLFNGIRLRQAFNKETYRDIPASHLFIAAGCGPVVFIASVAILFKILIMPGATWFLLVATVTSLPAIIISIIKILQRKHPGFYKRVITRMVLVAAVTCCLFSTPKLFFNKIRYRNQPQYIEILTNYLQTQTTQS